jgi:hypothetical protein
MKRLQQFITILLLTCFTQADFATEDTLIMHNGSKAGINRQ